MHVSLAAAIRIAVAASCSRSARAQRGARWSCVANVLALFAVPHRVPPLLPWARHCWLAGECAWSAAISACVVMRACRTAALLIAAPSQVPMLFIFSDDSLLLRTPAGSVGGWVGGWGGAGDHQGRQVLEAPVGSGPASLQTRWRGRTGISFCGRPQRSRSSRSGGARAPSVPEELELEQRH